MIRIIDLSHPIAPGMPVYPGTEPPKIEPATSIKEHGFEERLLTLFSHTGTHMDAPCHILPGAPTLSDLAPGRFVGPGRVIDVRGMDRVGAEHIEPHLAALRGCAFAILRTGWERLWGEVEYFEGFPVLTPEAAALLAGLGLSGVGVDAISVDAVGDDAYPVHKTLFGAGMVVVENLRNLDELTGTPFTFCALPLPIAGGDGSPVRAVGLVEG